MIQIYIFHCLRRSMRNDHQWTSLRSRLLSLFNLTDWCERWRSSLSSIDKYLKHKFFICWWIKQCETISATTTIILMISFEIIRQWFNDVERTWTARRVKEELKAHVDALISLTAKIMSVLYKLVKRISWSVNESSINFWINNVCNVSVLKQIFDTSSAKTCSLATKISWSKSFFIIYQAMNWLHLMNKYLIISWIKLALCYDIKRFKTLCENSEVIWWMKRWMHSQIKRDICFTDFSFKHDYFFKWRLQAISSTKWGFYQC